MLQIIDTSVAIKWFVKENGQDKALQILEQITTSPQNFAVPELFYFELSNVFNRLIPTPNKGQLQVLEEVIMLGVNRFSMTNELNEQIRKFQGPLNNPSKYRFVHIPMFLATRSDLSFLD